MLPRRYLKELTTAIAKMPEQVRREDVVELHLKAFREMGLRVDEDKFRRFSGFKKG